MYVSVTVTLLEYSACLCVLYINGVKLRSEDQPIWNGGYFESSFFLKGESISYIHNVYSRTAF